MDSLVTTEWLAGEMGASDLRIVDCTKHLAGTGRDALAEYEAGHIPGAVFMDLADLTDTSNPVDNMLPPAEKFASRMQSLGLGDGSRIVLYDDSAVKTSARAWFMLKMFGAHDVALLDGGIAKWKAEGRPLAQGKEQLRHRHFTAWQDDSNVRTKADVLANLHSKAEQVVDARGAARWSGADPDPRPGIASGHIPGSLNLPFSQHLNAEGLHRESAELNSQIAAVAGERDSAHVVYSCGSGVTATHAALMHVRAGRGMPKINPGSFSEWIADGSRAVATGDQL